MTLSTRTLSALLGFVWIFGPVVTPVIDATYQGGAEAGISIVAFSPDQHTMAQNALAKFDAYEMPIPDEYPLRIYFHEPGDYESCRGNAALATHGPDFEQIDICTSGEFALLHELSHVWANFEMDDGERAEFMELRGLEVWQGAPEWSANASEHSASIIAWGLGDTEVIPTMIPDHTRAELEEAFAFLTDNQTPVFLLPDEPISPDTVHADDDPLNRRATSPSGIPIPIPEDIATSGSAADAAGLTADAARDLLLPEDDLVPVAFLGSEVGGERLQPPHRGTSSQRVGAPRPRSPSAPRSRPPGHTFRVPDAYGAYGSHAGARKGQPDARHDDENTKPGRRDRRRGDAVDGGTGRRRSRGGRAERLVPRLRQRGPGDRCPQRGRSQRGLAAAEPGGTDRAVR